MVKLVSFNDSQVGNYLTPRFMASAVPTILIANNMLLQILAAWPDPTGPQYTMFLPTCSSIALALGNCSSGPPTMKVKVPALAAITPANSHEKDESQ
jgi:hypothetical protein